MRTPVIRVLSVLALTALAVWGGWIVYRYVPADQPWIATAGLCLLAVAWLVLVLNLRALPGAARACLWALIVIFCGRVLLTIITWDSELMIWEQIGLYAAVFIAWVYAVRTWNSWLGVFNGLYASVWLAGCVFAAGFVVRYVPGWCGWIDDTAAHILAIQIGSIGGWIALLAFRVPWRVPWVLPILLSTALGPIGMVVTTIGSVKLGIELAGRKNTLARSRLRGGRPAVRPLGLVGADTEEAVG